MAIREELSLDLSRALSQIDDLERELDSLLRPVEIPVTFDTGNAIQNLRSEIRQVDNDDIDIDVDSGDLTRAEGALEEMRREADRAEESIDDLGDQARRSGDEIETLGRRGSGAFGALRSNLGLLLSGVAAFAGARELISFFRDSIDAASDLQESTSKAQVVFGEFFDEIQQFASTAPQALGLANSAALEFTGTFGNLFTALGLSQEAAADLAPEIVQLGADLASFNNIEVTDALDKLRAGLVGEAEPLRALGVNLNAAAVEAKALELGLAGSKAEITDAAKVQARYALILEQTTTAQGDFARTADGVANRQRTLSAAFQNLQADIGEALLPAFEKLIDAGPALLEAIEGLVPVIRDFAESLADVDFGAAIDGARRFFNTISGTVAFLQGDAASAFISQGINDFTKSVEAGIEPAQAFEAVLGELAGRGIAGDIDLTTESAARLVDELGGFADLQLADLTALLTLVKELGPTIGLTEDEIEGLLIGLRDLIGEEITFDIGPNFRRAGRRAGDDFVSGLQQANIEGAVQRINNLTFEDLSAEIAGVFGGLPDELSAAREALRDEENNIVEDFDEFFNNLNAELEAREAFANNIALLRSLGLDDLADVFADLGLDSAQALADGLTDPAALAAAEARLEDFGASLATAEANAFLGEISDQLSSAELAIALTVNPVLGNLDFGILPVVENLVIPGNPQVPTITVNVESTGDAATDGARVAQTIGSVIGGVQ